MSALKVCTLALFVALGSGLQLGCSAGDSASVGEDLGQLNLALSSSSGGNTYNLRSVAFLVEGPAMSTVFGDDSAWTPTILQDLPAGNYQITLQPGWFLERIGADGSYAAFSNAVLELPATQPFAIASFETTQVNYQFRVDNQVISFDQGTLAVGISVTETGCNPAPEVCSDGIDNDCDGIIDQGCTPPPSVCAEEVGGDVPCPAGYGLATFEEASANVGASVACLEPGTSCVWPMGGRSTALVTGAGSDPSTRAGSATCFAQCL